MTDASLEKLADLITEKISVINPRWLKLKQAATYASICKGRLKELALEGVIRGYQDPASKRGDWIFDKESIDEFRLHPLKNMDAVVNDILGMI